MGDRFYDELEIALSSYSLATTDDYYNEEGRETEEEYEEDEVNDVEIDVKSEELACPFCLEDFDVLGLCCHIDADHRMEVKPGICPVCAAKVGINMASHVISQHESILKALCNKKHRGARSRSSIYILRKEMQEKHLRCIKESPSAGPSSNVASDSTLLSFVNNRQTTGKIQCIEASQSQTNNASLTATNSTADYMEKCSTPADLDNEKTRRCEFLQGLLFTAILDDL